MISCFMSIVILKRPPPNQQAEFGGGISSTWINKYNIMGKPGVKNASN